jgi:hypothetical protein
VCRPDAPGMTQVYNALVQRKLGRSLYSAQPVPNGRKLLVEEVVVDPHAVNVAGLPDAQLHQPDVS